MLWLVLFIILISTFLLFTKRSSRIPKIIWSYWHDHDTMPDVVKKCIESWKTQCPDWDIRVLSEKDTPKYRHSSDSHQRHSDFVRLDLLNKHGGVWLDASVYLNESLDWLDEYDDKELIGYYSNYEYHIESWFLAAPKGSQFIKDWHDEFMKYNDYETVEEYLKNEFKDVDYSHLGDGNYLLVYAPVLKLNRDRIKLFDSYSDGYMLHKKYNDNDEEMADDFCNSKTYTKMVKFRNGNRSFMESRKDTCDKLK